MGLKLFSGSSCGCSTDYTKIVPSDIYPNNVVTTKPLPNPNPKNFKIKEIEQVGKYLVVRVKYKDCTNFEGEKILVIEGIKRLRLLMLQDLDPHFCENSKHEYKIVARFRPEFKYWRFAIEFCKLMEKDLL